MTDKSIVKYNVSIRTIVNEWTIELSEEELKDFYINLKYAKSNSKFAQFPNVLVNPDHIVHTKSTIIKN